MSGAQPIKFGNKYSLLDLIGIGGVAEVYRGKLTGDKGFEKLIVIKKLLAQHTSDKEMVGIFIDEARLAALLQHENIATTHDFGEINGEYFLAMEYLFGKNLHSFMARAKTQPELFGLEHALAIGSKICDGMDYAHNLKDLQNKPLNLVHRDLTPHNIFITYDGKVKILDFGVAKAEIFDNKTREGVVKGKISYMSPERLSGEPIDLRSDIFSIGILLYEMISKTRMYHGDTAELIRKCINVEYQKLEDLLPGLPPEVYAILDKALAVELEKRYQNCAQMHADIEDLLFQMSQRIDSRYLKTSIRALFADEFEADREKISTTLQYDSDQSSIPSRDKTDITIPGRGSSDTFAESDRTRLMSPLPRWKSTTASWFENTCALINRTCKKYWQSYQNNPPDKRILIAGGAGLLLLLIGIFLVDGDTPPDVSETDIPEVAVASPEITEETKPDIEQSDNGVIIEEAAADTPGITEEIRPEIEQTGHSIIIEDVVEVVPPPSLSPPQSEGAQTISSDPAKVPVLKNQKILKIKSETPSSIVGKTDVLEASGKIEKADQPDTLDPVPHPPAIETQTLRFEKDEDSIRQDKIKTLHVQAEAALRKNHLLNPPQQSAYGFYKEILRLDPHNNRALDGILLIGDRYGELIDGALAAKNYGDADNYVQSGLLVAPDHQRLLNLQKRIDQERQDYIDALSEKADQCLADDKLMTPDKDSAYYYYNEIFRIDPDNTVVRKGFESIADRYAALADKDFTDFKYEMARAYVDRGLTIVPDHYYLLSLKENLSKSEFERYTISLKKRMNKVFAE